MFEQLMLFAQSNQQVAAALTLVVGGVASWALRSIPMKCWNMVLTQSTSEIELDNSNYWELDNRFTLFREWYIDHGLLWMSRRFVLESNGTITAGSGNQYFIYKKRLFWFSTEHLDSSGISFRKQVIRIRGLTRSQEMMREMIKTATARPVVEKTTINVYKFKQHGSWDVRWECVSNLPIVRDSVPLVNDNVYRVIKSALERFSEDRAWFQDNQIPYKRCFMFSGPPGTGKSTLAVKLAMQAGRDIYIADASLHGSDVFEHLIAAVPARSMILLEDVHSAQSLLLQEKIPEDSNGYRPSYAGASLTSVLNVLSGAIPLDDVIVVMTTNYKELLEPALYRPGRVDVDEVIGYLDTATILGWMVRTFGDVANRYKDYIFPEGITTGEVYRLYELHRNDIASIVAGLKAEERQHVGQDKEIPRRIDPYFAEGKVESSRAAVSAITD